MKKSKAFLTLGIFLLFGGILGFFITATEGLEKDNKIYDCYDDRGHKIIGLECEGSDYGDIKKEYMKVMIPSAIGIFMGILIVFFSIYRGSEYI